MAHALALQDSLDFEVSRLRHALNHATQEAADAGALGTAVQQEAQVIRLPLIASDCIG